MLTSHLAVEIFRLLLVAVCALRAVAKAHKTIFENSKNALIAILGLRMLQSRAPYTIYSEPDCTLERRNYG